MTYDNFLYKPFDKGDTARLRELPEFKDLSDELIFYIEIMWDFHGREWQRNFTDYYQIKREAARLAGIKSDDSGHYEKDIEDILVGANADFNNAVIRYLYLFGDPELVNIAAQRELQAADYAAAFNSKSITPGDRAKISLNIANSTAKLLEAEERAFGGKETENVRRALYRYMGSQKLRLRPEHIAEDTAKKKLSFKHRPQ